MFTICVCEEDSDKVLNDYQVICDVMAGAWGKKF